jgi:hypothetical protein
MCHPEQEDIFHLILPIRIYLDSMDELLEVFDCPLLVLMESQAHGLNEHVEVVEVELGGVLGVGAYHELSPEGPHAALFQSEDQILLVFMVGGVH